jgi:hypothetical protein
MVASKTFRHQHYELVCSALVTDSGKFTPLLSICNQAWPRRPRIIATERGNHPTPEMAIDAAYAQGVVWVQNYG